MTDQQLIAMLYENSPGELSAGQLRELRARMLASPRIKRAVADRVQLDQALTETIGRPHLQVASIVAACTAAAVAAPLATGVMAWIKGWSMTVWSGVVAATVSVPLAVIMVVHDPPQEATNDPATETPAVVEPIDDDSPSNDVPEGWAPLPSLAEGDAATESVDDDPETIDNTRNRGRGSLITEPDGD